MKRVITGVAVVAAIGLAVAGCSSPGTSSGPSPGSASATRSAISASASPAQASPNPSPAPVASGTVVASGTYAHQAGEPAGELFTRLQAGQAYPQASGSSEYSQHATSRELDVTVTFVSALAGHQVTVYVNGARAGPMTVSSTGSAFGTWATEHGQSVPAAPAGSKVEVRTG